MDWKTQLANWKTTLSAIITFLLSIPILVSALEKVANHQPVDWLNVAILGGMWATSHGLLEAKDGTTHSTPEQVAQSAIDNAPKQP